MRRPRSRNDHRPLPPRAARFAVFAILSIPWSVVAAQEPWTPTIPKVWDERALDGLELPNAATGVPAKHVDAAFYQRIPPAVIYRTYPVYHPDREPDGYLEKLAELEPEVVFDPAALRTKADWVRAGEAAFKWPTQVRAVTDESRARFRDLLTRVEMPVTADGIIPFYSYVIREKGTVESGNQSCSSCHTRVMPDGSVIVGAQGNLPFDHMFAESVESRPPPMTVAGATVLWGMPRVDGVPAPFPDSLTGAQLAAQLRAIPPGVLARHGSSAFHPVQIPDLIGIADRRYLDRTGLVRHRGIGDLMRYAALNIDLDFLSDYAGFVPDLSALDLMPPEAFPPDAPPLDEIRAEIRAPEGRFRYSDEQLYALALYLYELEPPPNPYRTDERAERGREVFVAEKCNRCHTPPLYTSNQLTPVEGFDVPAALRKSEDVRMQRVGTDPALALRTRRGTGFYKTPSLKGVWYRGPFSHDGSVATLEDWFDPARLRDDYVPTGWNPGGGPRAVRGHEFGLELPDPDRAALLAFLRTL